MSGTFDDKWNHNSHYYELVADELDDPRFDGVVDVGCGEGTLARYLAERMEGREVVGVDADPRILAPDTEHVHFVLGSGENLPIASASAKAIVAVASLHQMDEKLALAEMRRVIAPGGRIVIVGTAKSAPLDPHELRDAAAHAITSRGKTAWDPPTETEDPELSWAETRAMLDDFLPGNRWRRLPMWRYLCVWDAE